MGFTSPWADLTNVILPRGAAFGKRYMRGKGAAKPFEGCLIGVFAIRHTNKPHGVRPDALLI
jgi:hypothetical protein